VPIFGEIEPFFAFLKRLDLKKFCKNGAVEWEQH
jgi:hypothetical protein